MSNLSEWLRFTAGDPSVRGPRVPASKFELMVALIRASERSYGHAFGLKAPHHEFNHLHGSLQRVKAGAGATPILVSDERIGQETHRR